MEKVKVKALSDFSHNGLLRFQKDEVFKVGEKWDRFWLSIPKHERPVLLPVGVVRKATEEEIKEFENKQEEVKK